MSDFPLRNVTNDTELADVVGKLNSILGDGDASTIKTSEDFRTKVFTGMSELTETLGQLVEERPSRKFLLDED